MIELIECKKELALALEKAPVVVIEQIEDVVIFVNKETQMKYCTKRLRKAVFIGLDTVSHFYQVYGARERCNFL